MIVYQRKYIITENSQSLQISLSLVCLAVSIGGAAIPLQKHFGVVAQVVETAGGGDLGDAEGGIAKQVAADLHTVVVQEGDW